MQNQNYEIRNINGKDVFVKNIVDSFWLFNDVYIYLLPERVVSDDVIIEALSAKDDEMFPYPGAESEFVLHEHRMGEDIAVFFYSLSVYKDKNIRKLALEAYNECELL